MATQNSKGQALLEMILSLTLFLVIWIYVQKSLERQNKNFKNWEIGRETQTKFQKNLGK